MNENVSEKEMIKISIEEFSRLQNYMIEVEKDSNAYKTMKRSKGLFTGIRRKSYRIRHNKRVTQLNNQHTNQGVESY